MSLSGHFLLLAMGTITQFTDQRVKLEPGTGILFLGHPALILRRSIIS